MKITEIHFSKKMPYAPYLNLTPGFVATLEEGEKNKFGYLMKVSNFTMRQC